VVADGFHVELDGLLSARLIGELDLSSYDAATASLSPLFEAAGDVVLDMSELSFVDSSGIRLFIRLHQALHDRGGLILRSPTPHVARVLEIAGLPELGIRMEKEPE
jgi:anti-sigma B factor antagonist